MSEISSGNLGVVVGLELDSTVALQPLPQPIVVRQRTVLYETQVEAGEKGCECSVVIALSVAMRVWPMA